VKDFRNYRIENRPRLEEGTLSIELGQKVHSSIACLVGFYRTATTTPNPWAPFVHLLSNRSKPVKVVLWLEHDLPSDPIGRRKALHSVGVNKYKPRLRWFTPYVFISSLDANILDNVQVRNLPRPPA